MKILILIPIYKRTEVLRICLDNLSKFINTVSWEIQVVCLMSPEDSFLKENQKSVKKHGFKAIYYKNLPLGEKMNAGIEYVMSHYEFDYLMNFGSDDLIHADIEQLYEPYLNKRYKLFGINGLYFYELSTGKTIFFHNYNYIGSIGAGRMIAYDLLKQFYDQQYPLYEPKLNSGLDTSSAMSLKRMSDVVDIVAEVGNHPYIVDIKTDTNINLMMHIETRATSITYIDNSFIHKYFKI